MVADCRQQLGWVRLRSDSGFGLVEAMVAMALFLLVTVGASSVMATALDVVAHDNWWGAPGAPKPSQTAVRTNGSIDAARPLPTKPACGQ